MDLKEIQQPVKDFLAETDSILKKSLINEIELINKINEFTPVSKGKKIRSTLLLLLAGIKNSLSTDLSEFAASIEMFHLSSLIHDDIIDNSEFRRGEKTLNANVGNYLSVLWGDFLLISSLDIFIKTKMKLFLDRILKIAKLMVEGQVLEEENTFNFDIELETYYSIVEKKTSSLFAGISEMISLSNGDLPDISREFYKFGLNFGSMFQIKDDMLDIFSENSGKDRFRDLKGGKITLPVILLLEKSNNNMIRDFSEKNQEQLLTLFKKFRIEELLFERINEFYKECMGFLDKYPDSIYKESLLGLLNFIRYRDY